MSRTVFALVLLILPSSSLAEVYPARVVGITDGDTLTVLTAEKKQIKIRLAGIDAPESDQDFGQRAKQLASELAFDKEVTVKAQGTDRYGRTIADVFLPDKTNLNLEMVERGMAWHFKKYAPDDIILIRAQVCAKKVKLGIWSQPNPIPPWEWRKGIGRKLKGFVGNRRSRVFHRADCPGAIKMKAENRETFPSEKEAEAAGYRRARDCWSK